jgi:hypothetical protein
MHSITRRKGRGYELRIRKIKVEALSEHREGKPAGEADGRG